MTNFSFRELECFLAVAEELSFTRAAERLHLAQPPLSRHIRQLEEKLGVELFQRSRRKVSITAAGKAFREEAQEILARIRRAGDAAKRAAAGETEHLHIGFVSAVLSKELVELFCRFRNAHPNTRLNLHDRLPSEQIQELTNGDLDIGFIGIAPEKLPRNVIATSWMMERLMAFLPPQHKLSGKKSIRLADLADESFVAISSEAAPAFSSHLRKICKEEGFQAHIVQEARRAQAVAAMSVTGSGVAILPASLHRLTGNGIPLRTSGNRKAEIEYVVAAKSSANESVEQFLDLVS
ncbi:MAG: LysR substrate-binding domain-containing protein [Verrucomicrobiales bacterium]